MHARTHTRTHTPELIAVSSLSPTPLPLPAGDSVTRLAATRSCLWGWNPVLLLCPGKEAIIAQGLGSLSALSGSTKAQF